MNQKTTRSPRGLRNTSKLFNTPADKKTNASVSGKASFLLRKQHVVDREDGIPGALKNIESIRNIKKTTIPSGNLAINHLNPTLVHGPRLVSNSPKSFDPNLPPVKIIPLGGTNEVGLNITAIERGDDIIIIDTGMGFGDGERFPGIEYVVPETKYLENNKHKIRGLIYTHGHLDHIGAAPYVLPKLGPIPIFAMPLTLALLKNRLQEFEIDQKFTAKVINPSEPLTLGSFKVQFFRLNHSICDTIGLAIDTDMGRILYCTDWKFDSTPFDGQISDYGKLAKLGDEGVRILLTDSLGALVPGKSMSEMDVKKSLVSIFKECKERIIVTSFASTIARIQFTIDCCEMFDRKLALIGRSMVNNFNVCFELGYIRVPKGLVINLEDTEKLPPEKVCILSTGNQGEDLSALTRMSKDEHPQMRLQAGDSVIFTSSVIQGNETAVEALKANLSRKGVTVYDNKEFKVHVSGHACQEDLKMMINLTRPDYLQPIHGDHYIIRKMGEIGQKCGIPWENILLTENGKITLLGPDSVEALDEVVNDGYVLVDGLGIGTVSEEVLDERRQMGKEGAVVVIAMINKQRQLIARPEIVVRGFVYYRSSQDMVEELKNKIYQKLARSSGNQSDNFYANFRANIRSIAAEFIVQKTEKSPMIIPIVVQV